MRIKILLTTLLCIISSLGLAQEITVTDFILLEKEQQTQTIRLIHQFLIEYEAQTFIQQKKLKRKYQTYIKILDYFITSSYAEGAPAEFNNIKCYYAGWISFIRVDENTGENYCVHPKRITYQENLDLLRSQGGEELVDFYKNNTAKKYESYYQGQKANSTKVKLINIDKNGKVTLTDGHQNCSSGENMACNPEVYGSNNGETLCVQSSGNYGVNASYACDKALSYLKDSDPSTYQTYLNSVTDGILTGGDNNSALEILKVMYDTCLCKGEKGLSNKDYSQKIFGTRTCAGILSQTQNISDKIKKTCEEKPNSLSNLNPETLNFIFKANKQLGDKINNIRFIPFPNKDNIEANRDKVLEIFKQDQGLFLNDAETQYTNAKSAGLCNPPGFVSPPSEKEENNSSVNVTSENYLIKNKTLYNLLDVKLILKGEEIAKEKIQTEKITYTPGLITLKDTSSYTTKTPEKESNHSYTYDDISGDVPLKLAPPTLNCELTINKEEKSILITPKDLEKIQALDLKKLPEGIKLEASLTPAFTQDEKNPLLFKTEDKDLNVEISANAKIQFENAAINFTCKKEQEQEQEQESNETQIKSCHITLSKTLNPDGKYQISADLKFFEDEESKKELDPEKEENKKLLKAIKADISWFDQGIPSNNKSEKKKDKKEDKTENTLDSGDLASLDSDTKPEEKEKKEDTASVLDKLKKTFFMYKGQDGKSWHEPTLNNIPTLAKERNISVYVKFNGKNIPKGCSEKFESVSIPATRPSNDSPVLQSPIDSSIAPSRGNVFQMQR